MAGTVKPYSVRFMSGRGKTRTETFTVPEGYRAIVLHLGFVWWNLEGYAAASLHGTALYYITRPAAPTATAVFEAVRFTLYERETLAVTIVSQDMSYAADGYLLRDDDGRPDDADNDVTVHLVEDDLEGLAA